MALLISIVYFSGTGNTEAVTDLIAKELRKENKVEIFKVEDITKKKSTYDINRYDMIGIGYPIYGFNHPLIIDDFIKKLTSVNKKKAFIYSTCAGPFYLNDIASYGLKKKLTKKGFEIIYEKQFSMPANILTRFKDEVSKQLYNAAVIKAKKMCGDINLNIKKVRNDGFIAGLIRLLYVPFEKISWFTVPLDFKVLKSCNLCRKCINSCPQQNIYLKKERVKYRLNCMACYRCVYNCPEKSITGRIYKIAIFKDGYDIKKIINNENIKGNFITEKTKGYYKLYYKYLNED